NNKNYSGEIVNGVARIPIDKLNEGNYSVFANYTGDKNFTNASVTQDNMVNVHKFVCYTMNVTANDTKVDVNTTIVVNLPSDASGNVSIYVNGTWAGNATVSQGVAKLNVSKAAAGKYVVNATFTDGKYANKTVTTNYYVFKHDSPLDIDVESILVDDVAYINVTAPSDNVTIEINGKSYDAQSYADGVARFVVSGLDYGNKTVVAKYGGSYKYVANSTTDKFAVDKHNTTINITVESIKYGEKLNITVNVTEEAEGFITIRINDTLNITLPVNHGKVNWIVEGLAADNYTVYADYSGDTKYNVNGTDKAAEVAKATPVIIINEASVDALNNASAIVIINTTATGKMNITVDGKNYTADIIDGIATFTVDVLPVGKYNITATYAGDNNYTNASELLENGLTVTKVASYGMNASANDTFVGENTTIVVNVPLDATGKVVIYVNGTWAGNATVDHGVAKLNVTKDVAGRYIVNATLVDAKYANQTVTTAYWVSKVDTPINITVVNDNIKVGDTVEVIVSLPDDINAKTVTVEINGKKYTNVTDNKGNATIYIPSVTFGNKTIVASYGGDNRYVANSTTANFTVTKRSSYVNVTVNDTIHVGENATVSVEVPSNATGYVIVNVGGNNYTINLTSGARSVVIAGLGNTTYRVNVTYLGDDQYLSSINNTQLIKVNKVESSINLTIANDGIIANGTSINITVETLDATGKVNITISNETYNKTYTIYVNDGKGNLLIDYLGIGKYNVTATYLGDDKYLTSTNETDLEVYDNANDLYVIDGGNVPVNVNETISIIVEGNHLGDEVTVIISNASGVILTRNATLEEVSAIYGIESSIAHLTLPKLEAGHYDVYAYYIETNGSKVILHEGTDDFNVYKLSSEISIKEIRNITVGENVTIDLELKPGDATGNISVFVNGVEYKVNETNLTITVPNLGAKEYNVTAFYYGNDMYNASEASSVFRVDKNDAPITINVTNSKVGEIERINVTLPNGTTGQILLDIGDNHYYANITEGLAQFNITGLKAGEYKVNATYLGDYKYSSNNTNTSITVEDVKVTPEPVVIDQGNGTVVVVVGGNATGNVTVKVGDKEFNATVVNGTAVVTLENVTPGTHDIEVIYSGDDNYANATTNATATIPKYDSPINVTVGEAKEGENVTVTVTVHGNATGNVTVIIDGKEYSAVVDNGTATVVVENLTAGPKSVIVEYSGDDNFTANYTVGNFTVEKAMIVPDIVVVDQGNGTVVVVVGGNATGNVTVKVGDQNFTADVINGTAIVDVGNLVPGNNTVEVIYSGDDTHTNGTVPAVIEGLKYDSPINVTVGEAKEGEPVVITVEVPLGATGDVIVYVGGENHTGTIDPETGKAFVTVENLSAGNHTVAVEYLGDDNFTANYTIGNMAVEKAKVTPDISVVDLGNNTVVVVVGDNATGNVTVKVGDKEFNATVVNGTAVVTLDNVTPGTHEIEVIYSGDDTHTNATANANITSPKYDTPINVTVGEAKEGENVTVTVTVPGNATGNVTVIIDGQKYSAVVDNGTATVVVENLTAGDKSIIVEYSGDDNFTANYTVGNFTVEKAMIVPDIVVVDQGNGTVVVVVGGNATGNVTVTVGDQNFTAEVINGTAVVDVGNLVPGNNTVEVIYSGDDTHTNATVPAVIEGLKYDSPINVTVGEAKEGENVTVTVTVPGNATGNVTVIIDGQKYSAVVDNGTATVVVENLTAGDKSIIVEYSGDDNYASNYTVGNFTVEKAKITPDISVVDLGNGTVVVVVGDNATGNVTVKVGDKEFNATVVNGTAVVDVGNLVPGNNTVEVIYSGDDTHTNATVPAVINGPKYDSPINVTVGEAKEGEPVVITVEVPLGATGDVIVYVGGENHIGMIDPETGKAIVTVENLSAGNHTVAVEYLGDDNFTANYTIGNMTVEKAKVTPDISVVDLGNNTVVVVVGDNATGNVTVTVDGQNYTAEIVNGTAVVTLDNVTPGTHDIEVIYSGDDTHTNATANANITSPKYDSPINVTVGEAKEGEPTNITVIVPGNATGNITVIIDGQKYSVVVDNGTATVVVENLTAGPKSVIVEYPGDDNYASNYTVGNFTVEKAKVTPDIKVVDQGNGTVVVIVGDNATGNVTVTVDGQNYTAEVVNGTAVVTLDNVTPGTHDIEVIYSGDDTHTNATANGNITAPKYETPINVTISEVKEGENATVTITVPENATGNVTVTIDGQKYTAEVINGTATVEVENLTAGPKTILVEYDGDENYASNYTTSDFTVDKAKETSEVYVVDKGNGTVVIVVPNNATGNVTVKVGDQNYTAEIVNGTATVTLDNLVPGNNTIEVIYPGDDTHTNATVPAVVNGPKYDSQINVTVGEAKEDEPVIVTVEVPENATGNVTVTIDGKKYSAEIKDGKAVVEIDDLTAGDKSVIVEYPGDDNYASNYTVGNFTVEKAKSTPDIKVVDQGNGTVVVFVGDNATGNVTVTVDGQNYTAEVIDGMAVVTLDNVSAGTHDIEVIYSGDDTHSGSAKDSSIEVSDVDTPITVDVKDVYVGKNAVITVSVPENATGNITIEINGVSYTEEIIGGKATFTVGDLAAGDKTISVIYNGDKYYTHNATTGQFKVSKRPSTLTSTIEDLEVGENVTITVYGPGDASGQVLIDIDGVGYYVNMTNGVGTAQIPRIPSGIYNVNLTYMGDDKYLGSTDVSQFNVNKVKSFVIPQAHDIYVGELETIRVTVPVDATGNVTLIIDGEEYNFNLDTGILSATYSEGDMYSVAISGGKGEIVITGLPKGEYVVTARYNGDAKYLPAVNSTTFRVVNVESNMQVFDQHNGTVVVKVPCDATGNVTIRLGNETYTGIVENGSAIITLDNAPPGRHDIEVTYSGDDMYLPKTINSTVEIPKRFTPISVEAHDIYVGETEYVTVTLPDDATGNVTIEINAREYTSTVKDGKAVFEVEGLTYGNKTVAVKYYGDNSYVENFTTGQFEVLKVPSLVYGASNNILVGTTEIITATVPSDATGQVLFEVDGILYSAEIENDTAKISIPDLPAGNYTGRILYVGDEKYLSSNDTVSFTVSKYKPPISAAGDVIEVNNDGTVVVNLPEDATGNVTIVVDGKSYTEPVVNGKVVFSIPGLVVGEHSVVVYYSGDDKYLANATVTEIVVTDSHSDNNGTDKHPVKVYGEVSLADHQTGNPILILLLIILIFGSSQVRRFKK
ncbi:Ig-like domain repeat protein, partial [Methanobrevibacter sp.]|uniref:Ig-like domain repeat protein n=1 Tax=Methanobrevibacter sp. TaxID=66852 RepID=UPI00388E0455